ncbi:patatin-like phospholipase family protein [Rhodoblastus acidophilus]|uniref:patatin-like phospholipase family protein n=1 Tax=Rhodoblastus acidophilus TaxID=1074 RepID=UPI0022243724|nr:patatin-like phospholipase family protein [Rhodoblastus acidophilus]MCW2285442.1 hypothetical protein [Rhodoblastus acidophilus]
MTHWKPDPNFILRAALVFQGGGIRGLFFPGHVVGLSRNRVDKIIALGGASAGALVAIGLWSGLGPRELIEFIKSRSNRFFGLFPAMLSLGDFLHLVVSYILILPAVLIANTTLSLVGWVINTFCIVSFGSNNNFRSPSLNANLGCPGVKFERFINDMVWYGLERRHIHKDLVHDIHPDAKHLTLRQIAEVVVWIRTVNAISSFEHNDFQLALDGYPQLEAYKNKKSIKFTPDLERKNNIFDLIYDQPTATDAYFLPFFLTAACVDCAELLIVNNLEERFLDIPLSRLVRVSAGHPLVFWPKRLSPRGDAWKTKRYSDGGILLNFPAAKLNSELRRILSDPEIDADEFRDLKTSSFVTIGLATKDSDSSATYMRKLWHLVSGDAKNSVEMAQANDLPYFALLEQDTSDQPHYLRFDKVCRKLIEEIYTKSVDHACAFGTRSTVELAPFRAIIDDIFSRIHSTVLKRMNGSKDDYVRVILCVDTDLNRNSIDAPAILCYECRQCVSQSRNVSIIKLYEELVGIIRNSGIPAYCRMDLMQTVRQSDPTHLSCDASRIVNNRPNFCFVLPVFDYHFTTIEPRDVKRVPTDGYDDFLYLFDTGASGLVHAVLLIDGSIAFANHDFDETVNYIIEQSLIQTLERHALELSSVMEQAIKSKLNGTI